jgi:predicted peptidase
MKYMRFTAICLTLLGIISISASCGGPAKEADALLTTFGTVSGVVVKYNQIIDGESVTPESFEIQGKIITSLFVSDSNPFKKDAGKQEKAGENNGHYVIIFVKDDPSAGVIYAPIEISIGDEAPKVDVRIKQIAPVNTAAGKVIEPWDEEIVTKKSFFVAGGPA